MLKQLKITGAGHRFFCGLGMLGFMWGFHAGNVSAQILLPEQVEAVEAPRGGPEVSSAESVPDKEVQKAIQQLQRNQGRFDAGMQEEIRNLPEMHLLEAAELRYERAVDKLRVRGRLTSGEPFQGELRNRSFKVENAAGKFPLLLSELRQCRRHENDGGFVFDLQGGDQLTGWPQMEVVKLQLLEGVERVILLRDVVSLDFLPLP